MKSNKFHHETNRREFIECSARIVAISAIAGMTPDIFAQAEKKDKKAGKVQTPLPTHPPLQSVNITELPAGLERLDLFLLIGQSNMKGRGIMPEEPKRDPRIVMMHMKDDSWYLARHPLHLVGDAKTFKGADNAGVGSGLAFAEAVAAKQAKNRIGLIPCAVGGSQIALWQKGARLYDEAVRRAKLAAKTTESVRGKFRAALWLQGEADSPPERRQVYEQKLLKMIDDLRADLNEPNLPFIACTIGEMKPDSENAKEMNKLLLSFPDKKKFTACVDARDQKTHIGDNVHFDTAAQVEIGRRFAQKYLTLIKE